ncbi:uncharacterized protein VTP21DRAFT_7755 [Calcarisporiella thermophila]|uniref:uncharacterized protein n=1 Tax=Calcarisporiella thermophila TaxID=911321 RepID=UPI0037426D92
MKFLGLVSVLLTFTFALGAPHKRQVETPEYVLQLINTIRQAHGVKALPWNRELERAALAHVLTCVKPTPSPSNTTSLVYYGARSWKSAITTFYTIGLAQYDFNNPKSSDANFMFLMASKYKSVGCSDTNCNGTNVYQCLFDFEGEPYHTINEFVDDVKANVRPANSTLTFDSVTPKSTFTNFAPQSFSAYISS